jgi:hypothetical protein
MMAEDAITVEAAPQPVVLMRGADTKVAVGAKVVDTRSAGTSSMHRQPTLEAHGPTLVMPKQRMGHPTPQLRMGQHMPQQRTVVVQLTAVEQPMAAVAVMPVVNTSNLNS